MIILVGEDMFHHSNVQLNSSMPFCCFASLLCFEWKLGYSEFSFCPCTIGAPVGAVVGRNDLNPSRSASSISGSSPGKVFVQSRWFFVFYICLPKMNLFTPAISICYEVLALLLSSRLKKRRQDSLHTEYEKFVCSHNKDASLNGWMTWSWLEVKTTTKVQHRGFKYWTRVTLGWPYRPTRNDNPISSIITTLALYYTRCCTNLFLSCTKIT